MFPFLRRSKEHVYACCYSEVDIDLTTYSQVSILNLKYKILQGVNSVSMIQLSGPSLIPSHYISVRITNN